MKRCPITYEPIDDDSSYSQRGLRKLSPRLLELQDFPYSVLGQQQEAAVRAAKMSIQGVQPKLSVVLNVTASTFEIVDRRGRYIIKPQNTPYPELPENEDLTMRLAAVVGIKTPIHGLIRCQDQSLSYIVKRFDRTGRTAKVPLEDFAQLAGCSRETKYDYSLERAAKLLDHCTFPVVEKAEFFKRLLFCFVTGNEDMHLKNFSLITHKGRVGLAPAYDFLNTTIIYQAMGRDVRDIEESALSLCGRKKKLNRSLWLNYFGRERLSLPEAIISDTVQALSAGREQWAELIDHSFLSQDAREMYVELVNSRFERLGV